VISTVRITSAQHGKQLRSRRCSCIAIHRHAGSHAGLWHACTAELYVQTYASINHINAALYVHTRVQVAQKQAILGLLTDLVHFHSTTESVGDSFNRRNRIPQKTFAAVTFGATFLGSRGSSTHFKASLRKSKSGVVTCVLQPSDCLTVKQLDAREKTDKIVVRVQISQKLSTAVIVL